MRRIFIIRHGRTELNHKKQLQGRVDAALDEVGIQQAQQIASYLSTRPNTNITRVLTSPLLRASQTASWLGDALGLHCEVEERLVELNYGNWEGRAVKDVSADEWARWKQDLSFAPPHGESLQSVADRVSSLMAELMKEGNKHHSETNGHTNEQIGDIALFTHVSPIKSAIADCLEVSQQSTWNMFVAQASISTILQRKNASVLESFNLTSHLDGAREN